MTDFETLQNTILDSCGCCQGIEAEAPQPIENRPGLSAIRYRVGTHSTFKQTMLAGLTDIQRPALKPFTSRADRDFSIGLIDAVAVMCDVLTFYGERFANEPYLRTATERYSILQLARLIGYELRPGVAASTWLAFTVEDTPGTPGRASVEAGTKVQSIPEPNEMPQTFETSVAIEARAAWNAMPARRTKPNPISEGQKEWYFEGTATNLRSGDGLLVAPPDGKGEPFFRLVDEVIPQPEQGRTLVTLQEPSDAANARVKTTDKTFKAQKILGYMSDASKYYTATGVVSSGTMKADSEMVYFIVGDVFNNLATTAPPAKRVITFRQRASIFGYNAPLWSDKLPPPYNDAATYQNNWVDNANLSRYSDCVPLDNTYPAVAKDSWMILKDGAKARLFQVTGVNDIGKQDFALSAKVTCLALASTDGNPSLSDFSVLGTTAYMKSEELRLARLPITEAVTGATIDLESLVEGLYTGQNILVTGELATATGVQGVEPAVIKEVLYHVGASTEGEDVGYTTITLQAGLQKSFVPSSVRVLGNVCQATHGETKQEVLGSGNASQAFQRFALRQKPLTHISASTPSGARSTLEVRVNNILWQEVTSLVEYGPEARIYAIQIDNDRNAILQFGGGHSMGSRLPSGLENVAARYRIGMGLEGLVKAGALSMLPSKPYGVRSVTNPLPATGAAAAETLEEARWNVPLTILTLDRIVSIQDYSDFARAFAGVAKAHVRMDSNRRVIVTVAGPNGADIPPESQTYINLITAIRQASDLVIPVRVISYRKRFFTITGALKVLPDYQTPAVLAAVEAALRSKFSFDQREFNQRVRDSEVITAVQQVEGVEAVNLAPIAFVNPPNIAGLASDPDAAELLLISPNPLEMGAMT